MGSHQETKSDGNDDGGDNRDGSEVEITKVAGECLSDDSHGEHGEAAEDGGTCNLP